MGSNLLKAASPRPGSQTLVLGPAFSAAFAAVSPLSRWSTWFSQRTTIVS